LFDTTGLPLTFDQLSGGEREIAFLVGQIDRFGLRKGLFLLDEPELHLNADLIRTWVAFLTSTVETGQIWLATHSLEAVEAAGQQSTFVLERNDQTKKVDTLARLDTRPVLAALSRAVGTPAFSISQLVFVFVEGEEGVGERERFRKLTGSSSVFRFIECGSGTEVIRRLSATRALAENSPTGIRLGGVVDRDFRTVQEIGQLSQSGIHVLGVHEIENFFLHPQSLGALWTQNGIDNVKIGEDLRKYSDERAGSWIFQYSMATISAKKLPDVNTSTKEWVKGLSWRDFERDTEAAVTSILQRSGFDGENSGKLRAILSVGIEIYKRKRSEDTLWRDCEGKQILNEMARTGGFASGPALIEAMLVLWLQKQELIPQEVNSLRAYLSHL
jgi:hypothetical protein